jgi:hypothetical protein
MIEVVDKAGKTIVGWDRELWCREILDAAARADVYSRAGKIQAELFNWDNIVIKYLSTLC